MKVRIYQKPRNINQSGLGSSKWLIEFISSSRDQTMNSVMGWTSSSDMTQELSLSFPDEASAVAFAQENNLEFEVIEPKIRQLIKKSYADNFQ
jgi:hypothetical protein